MKTISLLVLLLVICPFSIASTGHRSSSHSGSHTSYSSGYRSRSSSGYRSRSYSAYGSSSHSRHSSRSYSSYSGISRDSHGRIKRSTAAKDDFKREHPCPANGHRSGSCPGYVIDHVMPLKGGGADAPSNMQWQTKEAAKAKDRVE